MEEIRAVIQFYDEHGWDWTSVVTYIGIRQTFGGWSELCASLRPQSKGRPRKAVK